LLSLVLLATGPLLAQRGHAYWDANVDSLRQVLARPSADTARLRTLEHLIECWGHASMAQLSPYLEQTVALARRLHCPEHLAYRLWLNGGQLAYMDLPDAEQDQAAKAQGLDSMQASVNQFDRLGRQQPSLLRHTYSIFITLQKRDAAQAYFEAKLSYYRQRGTTQSMAPCYHALASCYRFKGDYNRAISNYLQAAECYRSFDTYLYYNEISVVGAVYARWENYDKAEFYLRQALAYHNPERRFFVYQNLAIIYLHRRNYVGAAQAADQALQNVDAELRKDANAAEQKALALALKATILVAQQHLAEAGRLLPQAQHLGDSLHVPIDTFNGDFEMDAAWARYYAARGEPSRAETAWRTAYRKARRAHSQPLKLRYLRELANFYEQRGQPAQVAPYSLAAARLNDSLQEIQGIFRVSYYEQQGAI
jgi:tetratricopeptide (TPR) repeat protein